MCINEILLMHHNVLRSQRQKLNLGSEAQGSFVYNRYLILENSLGKKKVRVREKSQDIIPEHYDGKSVKGFP